MSYHPLHIDLVCVCVCDVSDVCVCVCVSLLVAGTMIHVGWTLERFKLFVCELCNVTSGCRDNDRCWVECVCEDI